MPTLPDCWKIKNTPHIYEKAQAAGSRNLLLAGVEGVGLGILGIGLPDIPLLPA